MERSRVRQHRRPPSTKLPRGSVVQAPTTRDGSASPCCLQRSSLSGTWCKASASTHRSAQRSSCFNEAPFQERGAGRRLGRRSGATTRFNEAPFRERSASRSPAPLSVRSHRASTKLPFGSVVQAARRSGFRRRRASTKLPFGSVVQAEAPLDLLVGRAELQRSSLSGA